MSTVQDKHPATSPLSEGTVEKRQLAPQAQEESFSYDSEVTIMNSDFLSSTLLDTSVTKSSGGVAPGSLKEELRSVLCDPDILGIISKTVASQVCSDLMGEITLLKKQLHNKDNVTR